MQKYVNVYLLNSPYHIDKPFTYSLPEEHSLKDIKEGTLVSVPFGRSDRASFGVVVGFDAPTENIKVKPVRSVLDDRFSLSEEMLGLCLFLKEHTLCTVGEAVRAMTPAPVFSACQMLAFKCSILPLFTYMSQLHLIIRVSLTLPISRKWKPHMWLILLSAHHSSHIDRSPRKTT